MFNVYDHVFSIQWCYYNNIWWWLCH